MVDRTGSQKRFKDRVNGKRHAGHGELHDLMQQLGITQRDFCRLSGISERTFVGWYGHPMNDLPINFLRYVAWAQKMAEFLASKGWDPEKFKPVPLPPMKIGRYPRKDGDVQFTNFGGD